MPGLVHALELLFEPGPIAGLAMKDRQALLCLVLDKAPSTSAYLKSLVGRGFLLLCLSQAIAQLVCLTRCTSLCPL